MPEQKPEVTIAENSNRPCFFLMTQVVHHRISTIYIHSLNLRSLCAVKLFIAGLAYTRRI
jgi:hypothetical protein